MNLCSLRKLWLLDVILCFHLIYLNQFRLLVTNYSLAIFQKLLSGLKLHTVRHKGNILIC